MLKNLVEWILTNIIPLIQTIVFGWQAWMLLKTVKASVQQSQDMQASIEQSTRAASALEHSAETSQAASKNVVTIIEHYSQQIRPYLSVHFGGGVYQDTKCRFGVNPILVNSGQTPAYNVKYTAKATVLPFPLPNDYTSPPLEFPQSTFGILAPHHQFTINAIVQERCDANDIEDIKRGRGRRVYIWGKVIYTDKTTDPSKERYTNFAHSIFWVSTPQGETIFGNYADRHNDAT
jgi:hypothetical protein